MKNTIIWAGKNKLSAQILLTCTLLFLAAFSFLGGTFTAMKGISIGNFKFIYITAALFLPILILYPSKRERKTMAVLREYIKKWKMYDLVLVIIFSATAFCFGNQSNHKAFSEYSGVQLISSVADVPVLYNVGNQNRTSNGLKERILDGFDKVQLKIKSFVKSITEKELSKNRLANSLLIFLMLLGYMIIVFSASLFACSLSCNGFPIAALVVFVSAQVICLTGFFFGIRALLKQRQSWVNEKYRWSKKKLNARIIWATIGAFFSPLLALIFF